MRLKLLTLWLVVAGASSAAWAHDTWFQRRPQSTPAQPALHLGTGNQFPVFESPNGIEHIVSSGCRGGGAQRSPLVDVDPSTQDLILGPAQPLPKSSPRIACWTQLQPFEVEFDDELVDLYFKEANPPAEVRQAWQAQKAKGQRWRERYVKHARLEWFPGPATVEAEPATPVPMGMDALLLAPRAAPKAGEELLFQLLRNGQPLPHFAVEFRHSGSRFGVWRRTDDQGQVRLSLPTAGRWLLRGIQLTPPPAASEAPLWQGHFITLAFDLR